MAIPNMALDHEFLRTPAERSFEMPLISKHMMPNINIGHFVKIPDGPSLAWKPRILVNVVHHFHHHHQHLHHFHYCGRVRRAVGAGLLDKSIIEWRWSRGESGPLTVPGLKSFAEYCLRTLAIVFPRLSSTKLPE
jgi:hypothetical protein